MSVPKLKLGDLLSALAELAPSKIERFATTLGVPKRVIEETEANHPRDVYRVLSDAMSWWIANEEEISWEAVAAALEVTGVDERNLARQIRANQSQILNGMRLNCHMTLIL